MRATLAIKALTSIAHRFAEVNKFRPRLTSLKRQGYCRRHLGRELGGVCAYAQLLRELGAFLQCTYSNCDQSTVDAVERFARSLDFLVVDVELVHKGVLPAVRGKRIASIGAAATRLRKHLRGTQDAADCRDDWRKFGIVYYFLFNE